MCTFLTVGCGANQMWDATEVIVRLLYGVVLQGLLDCITSLGLKKGLHFLRVFMIRSLFVWLRKRMKSGKIKRTIVIHHQSSEAAVGVCGWFKQPRPSPIRLWGWVRLHTCCTSSNQRAQVKPAFTTHTHTHAHREWSHAWQHGTQGHGSSSSTNLYNKPVSYNTPLRPCLEEPSRSHIGGG